jgi:hypothetical protein
MAAFFAPSSLPANSQLAANHRLLGLPLGGDDRSQADAAVRDAAEPAGHADADTDIADFTESGQVFGVQ